MKKPVSEPEPLQFLESKSWFEKKNRKLKKSKIVLYVRLQGFPEPTTTGKTKRFR